MQQPTEHELLQWLEQGNEQAVSWLYRLYRAEFITWCSRQYNLQADETLDIFQETVVSFYYNARQGKLAHLNSSIKTYLFAIGRNLVLKRYRKHKMEVATQDFETLSLAGADTDIFETNERKNLLVSLLKKLGKPCYELLSLFYFRNFSMESIAEQMGYKNDKVAKSQKARCLKELKENAQVLKPDLL